MPPRKKEQAPAKPDDGLCPEHYPLGWGAVPESFDGVGCEHGSWTRPDAEAEPES